MLLERDHELSVLGALAAAAIFDRLLHDAEVLTINGPSFRLKGRLDALRQPVDASTSAAE